MKSMNAMQALERMIDGDILKKTPETLARAHLGFAAELIEAAGYELAQTRHADEVVMLLRLSALLEKMARGLNTPVEESANRP